MNGYSDRINHALAFAAKHYDQQVRRGTKAPYSTHSANLAVILTRYACDDDTVVAGILLDVVSDYARKADAEDVLEQRIGEKFGDGALKIALMVTERRLDDEGAEMDANERHEDRLARLLKASPEARVLAAADALHDSGTLLADLRRTMDVNSVWARVPGGRTRALEADRRVEERLAAGGPAHPIIEELRETLTALEATPV
jgi:(p)ppGpp synthase/HD superfamily hydrolase